MKVLLYWMILTVLLSQDVTAQAAVQILAMIVAIIAEISGEIMFEEKTMYELERIMSELENVGTIEGEHIMRCECVAGCTDNCADCATTNDNRW